MPSKKDYILMGVGALGAVLLVNYVPQTMVVLAESSNLEWSPLTADEVDMIRRISR